jgi:hypothetical protein
MPHTLRAAARAVGRDRTTLVRAIRAGRLSATKDAATGDWLIEPAELHRVYPPAEKQAVAGDAAGGDARLRTPNPPGETEGEVRELRARLADSQDQVADLRRRLDTATAQLGEALQQVRLLTDQRPPAKRAWWRWR